MGERGVEGWSFADVLPAFKLLENTPTGEDAYHGRTGPLPIRQRTDDELTPSLAGFIDAAVAHGFKRVHDFNGAEQNGVDGHPVNVVNGVRQNAALFYLTAEVGSDYPFLRRDLAVACRQHIETNPELTVSERTAVLGGTATELLPRLASRAS